MAFNRAIISRIRFLCSGVVRMSFCSTPQTERQMTTELNHILMAASLLIVAGHRIFPYRLNYGNTAWLPGGCVLTDRILDRPWEYDDPARGIGLLFSVMLALIGTLALIFILAPDLPDDVPAEGGFPPWRFFIRSMCLSSAFWRKDYGDGFCYADRLTAFSHGKTDMILPDCRSRICPSPDRCPATFRLSDCGRRVLRTLLHLPYPRLYPGIPAAGHNEYSDPIGLKEMYPESFNLLAFPPLCPHFLQCRCGGIPPYVLFFSGFFYQPHGSTLCLPLPSGNQGGRTRTQRLPALLEAELS